MDYAPFMTTLYLDVTHTSFSGLTTGIQRVVRKVTAELLRNHVAGIDHIRLVVALNDTFLLLDTAGIEQLLYPATITGRAPLPRLASRLVANAAARLPTLMDRMQRLRFARAAASSIDATLDRADIGAGDLLLLLDAFWGGSTTLDAARRCRKRGATVVGTVYDLIPVTHPAYMTPVAAKLFTRRLREAIQICDGFVAISQATADELARFAGSRRILTEVAYCGSDIAAPDAMDGQAQLAGFGYISVGTLEPRKGHAVILDAFERLWAEGSDARLTFVGRRGWDAGTLLRRCDDLIARGAPFRIIEDADDAMLANLLAQSSAAIAASQIEGFGLPLVEALNRDLPVIASDIPVFREIASGAVSFFAVSDPGALADAIRAFERDPAPMRVAARRFEWPTWHQAAPRYAEAALRIQELGRAKGSSMTATRG